MIPPLLLLYGFNEFLGEHVIAEVGRAFGQPRSEFNFKRYYFDGEEETGWEEILDEANSSSFSSAPRRSSPWSCATKRRSP